MLTDNKQHNTTVLVLVVLVVDAGMLCFSTSNDEVCCVAFGVIYSSIILLSTSADCALLCLRCCVGRNATSWECSYGMYEQKLVLVIA